MKTIALAGNPNCGKSALFNLLTGSDAHMGNWPGITVERKEGFCEGASGEWFQWIDLPGVYALSPYTPEERVTRNYLLEEFPDLVVNLADANSTERSLYLTLQLLELDIPVILVWNMEDIAEKKGIHIEKERLSRLLGIPVLGVSALSGEGVEKLLAIVEKEVVKRRRGRVVWGRESLPMELRVLAEELEQKGESHSLFRAIEQLEQSKAEKDWAKEFAEKRYSFIGKCMETAMGGKVQKDELPVWDKLFLNSLMGIPLFFLTMFMVFHITFGTSFLGTSIPAPGVFLRESAEKGIEILLVVLLGKMEPCFLKTFLQEGIGGGLGTAVSFLPQILCLFFFLDFLEDSGYMARAAFLLDKPMRKVGLSGRAFLPILTGFGCSVPAILSVRTLETEKTRRITRLIVPFFSCGARLPLYALLVAMFFEERVDFIIAFLYGLGIMAALLSAFLLQRLLGQKEEMPFMMEIPACHLPRWKNLRRSMKRHCEDYLKKVGTVILVASAAVWFLSRVSFSFELAESEGSIMAEIGRWISPVFVPLGFGDGEHGWKASAALLSGLLAKEAAVSVFGALGGAEDVFSTASAFSFLVFYLLYPPCVAAMGTYMSEESSKLWRIFAPVFWLGTAWAAAFFIYRVSILLW